MDSAVLEALGHADAQRLCAEELAALVTPEEADDEPDPITEELVEQAAASSADAGNGGWGGWLTADDHAQRVLGCEPFTPEWTEREAAYVRGAEAGATAWVALNAEALDVEAGVRDEAPETTDMPRAILADWLQDRGDGRAEALRAALALNAVAGE